MAAYKPKNDRASIAGSPVSIRNVFVRYNSLSFPAALES